MTSLTCIPFLNPLGHSPPAAFVKLPPASQPAVANLSENKSTTTTYTPWEYLGMAEVLLHVPAVRKTKQLRSRKAGRRKMRISQLTGRNFYAMVMGRNQEKYHTLSPQHFPTTGPGLVGMTMTEGGSSINTETGLVKCKMYTGQINESGCIVAMYINPHSTPPPSHIPLTMD